MLNSTEHDISTGHKNLNADYLKKFLALSLSDVVFIMLINVKMPTIFNIYEQDKFRAQLSEAWIFFLLHRDLNLLYIILQNGKMSNQSIGPRR